MYLGLVVVFAIQHFVMIFLYRGTEERKPNQITAHAKFQIKYECTYLFLPGI